MPSSSSSLSCKDLFLGKGRAGNRLTMLRTAPLVMMIVLVLALVRISTDMSGVHVTPLADTASNKTAGEATMRTKTTTGAVEARSSKRKKLTAHTGTTLRYDWTSLERLSPVAKRFEAHQTNCSKPFLRYNHIVSGLGSNIHVHSAHFCTAVEDGGHRFKSTLPWTWLDIEACAAEANQSVQDYGRGYSEFEMDTTMRINQRSSLECYFPGVEPYCPQDEILPKTVYDQLPVRVQLNSDSPNNCVNLMELAGGKSGLRAAAIEFYFTRVSPLLQREAEKQVQIVFGTDSIIPPNLITIHIRWGDKGGEMELQSAAVYINAVNTLLEQRRNRTNDIRYWNDSYTGVNIYLATEDPAAVKAFRDEAPKDWTVYVDTYFPAAGAGDMLAMPLAATQAGRITLALLLLSMEANTFVLTTASNWSRLMNELRQNVLDPRCGNCTLMFDLVYGEWR